ncbi:MAG: hypothetical protein KDA60_06625 [Planctomycetales bacterium]|nr:hypothetical protein [Planctomycetales bacterium]
MESIFLICAVAGGTVFLFQFVMALVGFDADGADGADGADLDMDLEVDADIDLDVDANTDLDGDLDADPHGSSAFFGMLSFRTIVAALTFFGIGGMASLESGLAPLGTLVIALICGSGAFFGMYHLMRGLHRLRHDGTLSIRRSLGQGGKVYVPIPGNKSGIGKVQLQVQNRIVEYRAVTTGSESLKTGDPIVVTEIVDPETVCVERQPEGAS